MKGIFANCDMHFVESLFEYTLVHFYAIAISPNNRTLRKKYIRQNLTNQKLSYCQNGESRMEKRVQDYTQDILDVIRSNTSPAAMSNKLEDFHANDLADAMPRLTVQERYKLYRILDLNMLSDIFE